MGGARRGVAKLGSLAELMPHRPRKPHQENNGRGDLDGVNLYEGEKALRIRGSNCQVVSCPSLLPKAKAIRADISASGGKKLGVSKLNPDPSTGPKVFVALEL